MPQSPDPQQVLDSLGLVAGGIAHDFNNLLVSVLAEASSMRDEPGLTEEVRLSFRRIESSARRMAQLTRQLLAFAGRAQVVTAPLDPDQLLEELHESLTRVIGPEVAFSVVCGAAGSVIDGDPSLLRQVLINLVSNASDAATTRVNVTSRVIAVDGVPFWQVEVADDGGGIDASLLARIFEPFFSTKASHQGLGLSAVHGIVRRLGGDVEVDTVIGTGTRFRVRLPIVVGVEAAPVRPSAEIPVPSRSLSGLHVLIVDDEPSVRSTVRRLLERRGATTMVANDGIEAEASLRSEPFHLVITDVAMPGSSGYDVLAVARETQPGVPVVLMSGYTEVIGRVDEHAPDAFLEKPFTAKAMDNTVDEVLNARR